MDACPRAVVASRRGTVAPEDLAVQNPDKFGPARLSCYAAGGCAITTLWIALQWRTNERADPLGSELLQRSLGLGPRCSLAIIA
jgi:hypothetical protein